jgi:hypothetical protein
MEKCHQDSDKGQRKDCMAGPALLDVRLDVDSSIRKPVHPGVYWHCFFLRQRQGVDGQLVTFCQRTDR